MSPRVFPVGRSFGDYHNIQLEHEGGQARLYSGDRDGRRFALKFAIRSGPISAAERLLWEGKLGALLRHRNLPRTDRIARHDGLSYVAFQWIDGASLFELLEHARATGAPLCWEELAYVLSEILAALDHVHTALIAHLDVSPDNIVVALGGTPTLVDFGISELIDGTPLSGLAGKAPYMAPEVRGGSAGPASDQYGLGVVMCELAGGDVEVSPIRAPTHLPSPLREIADRLLHAEPGERFPTCGEARVQLHAQVGWRARRRGRRALRQRVLRGAAPATRIRARAAAMTRARHNAAIAAIVFLIAAAVLLIATL